MKNRHLFKAFLAAALVGVSLAFSSCSKDDDSSSSNTNGNSQEQTETELVSELKCIVAEFASKYETLKKGEKVTVTLTDVSDANIAMVSETLRKMSGAKLSKAGSDNYIVVLLMESKDELKKIPAEIFKGCTAIVSVSIPECVELIESGAFDGCTALEAVKILSEVVEIQQGAFDNTNESIKFDAPESVVIPEINSSIEAKLLSPADIVDYVNASKEEIVTLNMALETYDEAAIKEALKLVNKEVKLVIPEGVTEIGDYAFCDLESLVYIQIPSSVQNIGAWAFAHCVNLKEITIPSGVKIIFAFCFYSCENLSSVVIPQGVEVIDSYAFGVCESLTNISIPESVTVLNQGAFAATGITSISIPQGVTYLSYGMFERCTNLTSVSLPDGLEVIDCAAFRDCSNLKSLTIPNSVKEISISAFENCEVEFIKPENALWVSEPYYLETFLENCTDDVVKLKMSSEFNSDSECFTFENTALKNTNKKVSLVLDPLDCYIGENYFKDCNGIVSVEIPGEVMFVGSSSFMGCSNLETAVMGEGVLTIYPDAFNGCGKLASITLPESLVELWEGAFANCPNLQTIYCSQAIYNKCHETYPQMVVKE